MTGPTFVSLSMSRNVRAGVESEGGGPLECVDKPINLSRAERAIRSWSASVVYGPSGAV